MLGSSERPITFAQLKPRLMNLVMNALQVETDPQNTHMLLGGLFLCVQDSAIFEKVEQITQPPNTETSTNLLSSGRWFFVIIFFCFVFFVFRLFVLFCYCAYFLFSFGYCEHTEHG